MKEKLLQILNEDLGKGDVTTALVPNNLTKAVITLKEDCVLAGLEEASFLFAERNVKNGSDFKDGDFLKAGTKILLMTGR